MGNPADRLPSTKALAVGFALATVFLAIMHLLFGDNVRHDLWHLDQERNVPSAYSASLLGFGAIAYWYAGRVRLLGGRNEWYVFGALLLLMSADEFTEIHERLEHATGVDWQLLYLPVVAAAAVAWFAVVRRLHDGHRAALIAGAAAWFIAQVFEELETKAGDVKVAAYDQLSFAEELLEMTGSALFLLAIYGLVVAAWRQRQDQSRRADSNR